MIKPAPNPNAILESTSNFNDTTMTSLATKYKVLETNLKQIIKRSNKYEQK